MAPLTLDAAGNLYGRGLSCWSGLADCQLWRCV